MDDDDEDAGVMTGTPDQQRIIALHKNMRHTAQAMADKLGEFDSERAEHALVVKTLTGLDAGRRCYRLIGGVLVEWTVKEVLPAVQTNLEGINNAMGKLSQDLKVKQKELADFELQYKIRPYGAQQAASSSAQSDEQQQQPPQQRTSPAATTSAAAAASGSPSKATGAPPKAGVK